MPPYEAIRDSFGPVYSPFEELDLEDILDEIFDFDLDLPLTPPPSPPRQLRVWPDVFWETTDNESSDHESSEEEESSRSLEQEDIGEGSETFSDLDLDDGLREDDPTQEIRESECRLPSRLTNQLALLLTTSMILLFFNWSWVNSQDLQLEPVSSFLWSLRGPIRDCKEFQINDSMTLTHTTVKDISNPIIKRILRLQYKPFNPHGSKIALDLCSKDLAAFPSHYVIFDHFVPIIFIAIQTYILIGSSGSSLAQKFGFMGPGGDDIDLTEIFCMGSLFLKIIWGLGTLGVGQYGIPTETKILYQYCKRSRRLISFVPFLQRFIGLLCCSAYKPKQFDSRIAMEMEVFRLEVAEIMNESSSTSATFPCLLPILKMMVMERVALGTLWFILDIVEWVLFCRIARRIQFSTTSDPDIIT